MVGVVHIWMADLASVADGLEDLLCADERARAARLLRERDRRLWVRSRGVLRALLARYLCLDPHTLRFILEEHGKPRLDTAAMSAIVESEGCAPPSRSLDLRFNLSHSGGIALFAVSLGDAVGIDIEVVRRPIDEVAIAARVLGRAHAERLSALDPQTRRREFLRAWVTREAAVKCSGTGLGRHEECASQTWTVELDVGPQAAAAVSAQQGPCELCLWQWSD